MTPEEWQRLEPWFDKLLDVSPDGREAWLADAAGLLDSDRILLGQLLHAHENVTDQLNSGLPPEIGQLIASDIIDPLIGKTIGPFTVDEEIGRGGMGVVYQGRRTGGGFDQDVVIKVLRLGIDTDDTRRRFLQERQILANLDHPAIVRLLDGGFTEDGRPYIVMNRIVGQGIDTYCDQHDLDTRSRVRLFLSVVEAVDYAHRHLIIHRDLKPSNILVDEQGKVHLLDFGIAKIADQDSDAGMTATQQRVMTPEYASPEQFLQQDVTTASDIYQLGVLLYRLLTSRFPFELANLTSREIEEQVCNTDPVSASRATRQPRTKSTLRGDLDLILDKSLRKEPVRRYHSAHELREDMIRWLSGDRIMARPDSFTYQARRLVKRHPLVMALLATVIVCSLGFTVFHVQRITAERDIARSESVRRKEVSDFLVNLLQVPDPTSVQGREVTARELLANAVDHISEDLSDVETKIRLLRVIGEVSSNLGLFEQADQALGEMVEDTVEMYGRRSLESATAQVELSELLRLAREYESAIVPAVEALSIRRELLPAGDLEIGRALKLVALLHRELHEFAKAEVEYHEAADILEAQLPLGDPRRIGVQIDLAYVLRTVGKVDEAEDLYRQALPVMRKDSEDFPVALPSALNNLAYLLNKKGHYPEAEILYIEAIEGNESYYGEAHPNTLMLRNNLAAVFRKQGKDVETRRELAIIIEQQEHLTGPDHWRTGVAHRSLGFYLFTVGEYDDAVLELNNALKNFEASLGADHLWTASAMAQVATCQHMLGDAQEADRLWSQASGVLSTSAAHEDRNVQGVLRRLAENLADNNEWRGRIVALMAPGD